MICRTIGDAMTIREFLEGDKRMVVLTLCALTVAVAVSVYVLEGAFTGGDTKRAVQLVQDYQIGPTSDERIVRYLQLKFPAEHRWHAEVLSSCHGYVRVIADVPTPQGVVAYLWDVDLIKGAIHPANPAGREILRELETLRAIHQRDAGGRATAVSGNKPP
jgi:hypothetical protein